MPLRDDAAWLAFVGHVRRSDLGRRTAEDRLRFVGRSGALRLGGPVAPQPSDARDLHVPRRLLGREILAGHAERGDLWFSIRRKRSGRIWDRIKDCPTSRSSRCARWTSGRFLVGKKRFSNRLGLLYGGYGRGKGQAPQPAEDTWIDRIPMLPWRDGKRLLAWSGGGLCEGLLERDFKFVRVPVALPYGWNSHDGYLSGIVAMAEIHGRRFGPPAACTNSTIAARSSAVGGEAPPAKATLTSPASLPSAGARSRPT